MHRPMLLIKTPDTKTLDIPVGNRFLTLPGTDIDSLQAAQFCRLIESAGPARGNDWIGNGVEVCQESFDSARTGLAKALLLDLGSVTDEQAKAIEEKLASILRALPRIVATIPSDELERNMVVRTDSLEPWYDQSWLSLAAAAHTSETDSPDKSGFRQMFGNKQGVGIVLLAVAAGIVLGLMATQLWPKGIPPGESGEKPTATQTTMGQTLDTSDSPVSGSATLSAPATLTPSSTERAPQDLSKVFLPGGANQAFETLETRPLSITDKHRERLALARRVLETSYAVLVTEWKAAVESWGHPPKRPPKAEELQHLYHTAEAYLSDSAVVSRKGLADLLDSDRQKQVEELKVKLSPERAELVVKVTVEGKELADWIFGQVRMYIDSDQRDSIPLRKAKPGTSRERSEKTQRFEFETTVPCRQFYTAWPNKIILHADLSKKDSEKSRISGAIESIAQGIDQHVQRDNASEARDLPLFSQTARFDHTTNNNDYWQYKPKTPGSGPLPDCTIDIKCDSLALPTPVEKKK
jgi:hypothetical protein